MEINKVGAKIVLWILILALLVFTAVRTLHFLSLTFPPDQQYVAYLALAAFDAGVLLWLYYSMKSAEGAAQRAIAYGMVFVCMAGVITTTIADMLMVSDKNGVINKLPPDIAIVALWAVMIVIALNVISGVLVHLCDPSHQRHMAQEGARDKIHSATLAHIHKQADIIAPQIAAQVAQHWAEVTISEMAGLLPAGGAQPIIAGVPAARGLPAPGQPDRVSPAQAAELDKTAVESDSKVKSILNRISEVLSGSNKPQASASLPQTASVPHPTATTAPAPRPFLNNPAQAAPAGGSVADRRRARRRQRLARPAAAPAPAQAPEPEVKPRAKKKLPKMKV